jgi:membrane protease YdiL (CAAX protease family)
MSMPGDEPIPVTLVPAPPPKGRTGLAWFAIIGTVVLLVGARAVPPTEATQQRADESEQRLDLAILELQMRYLVGLDQLRSQYPVLAGAITPEQICEQARQLAGGGFDQRLALVPVLGEIGGTAAAVSELRDLGRQAPPRPDQQKLYDILHELYRDYAVGRYDAPTMRPGQRLYLEERLGWFGELALHPDGPQRQPEAIAVAVGAGALAVEPGRFTAPGRAAVLEPATRTYLACAVASVFMLILLAAGFVGLVAFLMQLYRGGIALSLECGACPHAGVYAETFALWLFLYSLLSFVGSLVTEDVPLLLRAAVAMLLSLLTLAWPVLRGVPWSVVQSEIGWRAGPRGPVVEVISGIVAYIVNLPLVLFGLLVTLLLVVVQAQLAPPAAEPGSSSLPAHPLFQFLASAEWHNVLLIVLLASVIAPLVEETFFRGVLYRHLREMTCRLGRGPSMLLSALATGLLFAVIHPQGLVAVPVLLALACGFCLAREWRGTLLGAICAHGLNNGLVTLFALSALSR